MQETIYGPTDSGPLKVISPNEREIAQAHDSRRVDRVEKPAGLFGRDWRAGGNAAVPGSCGGLVRATEGKRPAAVARAEQASRRLLLLTSRVVNFSLTDR